MKHLAPGTFFTEDELAEMTARGNGSWRYFLSGTRLANAQKVAARAPPLAGERDPSAVEDLLRSMLSPGVELVPPEVLSWALELSNDPKLGDDVDQVLVAQQLVEEFLIRKVRSEIERRMFALRATKARLLSSSRTEDPKYGHSSDTKDLDRMLLQGSVILLDLDNKTWSTG